MTEVTLASDDRLLLFGYGLFETILITPNGPKFLSQHWQRMHDSARLLNIPIPSFPEWLEQIEKILVNGPNFSIPYALRVTLSGGAPAAGILPTLFGKTRSITYSSEQYQTGVTLFLLPVPRNENSPLTKLKTTNYLENILAKEEAVQNGAFEGLWLNSKGYVAEGTMSNIFFVKEGKLYTPALDCGCLPGTRRALVLELAASIGIESYEGHFSCAELLQADEVFITNALMGIMPVCRIDTDSFTVPTPHNSLSITRCLEQAYKGLL